MNLEIIATIVECVMNIIDYIENSIFWKRVICAVVGIFAIYAISALLQGIGAIKWW